MFSRKAEISRTTKINPSYILSSSAKSWGYTIIFISSYSALIYLQKRIRVHDLIEHIFRYFKICQQKFILIFSYLQEALTSKIFIQKIKWDSKCEFVSCWTNRRHPHSNTSITFGIGGQNTTKKTVKCSPEISEYNVFVRSNN